jgi:hypothetical protein
MANTPNIPSHANMAHQIGADFAMSARTAPVSAARGAAAEPRVLAERCAR